MSNQKNIGSRILKEKLGRTRGYKEEGAGRSSGEVFDEDILASYNHLTKGLGMMPSVEDIMEDLFEKYPEYEEYHDVSPLTVLRFHDIIKKSLEDLKLEFKESVSKRERNLSEKEGVFPYRVTVKAIVDYDDEVYGHQTPEQMLDSLFDSLPDRDVISRIPDPEGAIYGYLTPISFFVDFKNKNDAKAFFSSLDKKFFEVKLYTRIQERKFKEGFTSFKDLHDSFKNAIKDWNEAGGPSNPRITAFAKKVLVACRLKDTKMLKELIKEYSDALEGMGSLQNDLLDFVHNNTEDEVVANYINNVSPEKYNYTYEGYCQYCKDMGSEPFSKKKWDYLNGDSDFFEEAIEKDFEVHYGPEWSPKDIELHKSIDWKARNYEDYPVEDDCYEGNVYFYSFKEPSFTKKDTFCKHLRANPFYPPIYEPIHYKDGDKGFTSTMYDGRTHNGLSVHDRKESWDLYDMMSR